LVHVEALRCMTRLGIIIIIINPCKRLGMQGERIVLGARMVRCAGSGVDGTVERVVVTGRGARVLSSVCRANWYDV
jgi:hypothetical protein